MHRQVVHRSRGVRRHRAAAAHTALVLALAAVGAAAASGQAPAERATYIVIGDAPALAAYRGGIAGLAATAPGATGQRRLDVGSTASRGYRAYLARTQRALVGRVESRIGRAPELLFRYDAALNGLALRLTADEAEGIGSLPGVKRVVPDVTRQLLTDNGPSWIGAPGIWSGSATGGIAGTKGERVVVGVIDTGINTNHPSFADVGPVDGYNHTNPRGRFFGNCDPITGLPSCNDKLIGVYDFTGAPPLLGEDGNGHGSHTASTAAGNVLNADLVAPTYTLSRRISGVAPHANVIAYRACQELTGAAGLGACLLSSLVAAINQAVLDQVDVINYSIGGGSANPWSDADALAFLNARRAGIFVSASAGNEGPGPGTIGSPADAPWLLSVGASTHDRRLVNALVGMTGGSAPPADIEGKSLTSGYGPAPIVYAGDRGFPLCGDGAAAADGSAAINPFPPGTFSGEIVVCDRGTYGRVEKSQNVMEGGAGGFVLANDEASGDSLIGDAYAVPGVHISYLNGVALKAWLASGTGHTGSIRGTVLDIRSANGDVMASFSSRGPNPATGDLLKPDVTAPGVDILAAFHDGAGTPPQFGIISGTSMSSPHAAGAAALVRALHPTWTPDEVRSALMTTAFTTTPGTGSEVHGVLKEDGSTPADPFDMGAGRVDLRLAGKAGLVLDETPANYASANPLAGGDPKALNLASLADDACDGGCSWRRIVKNAKSTSVTWTASASGSPGLSITVAPKTFTLGAGASRTIIVTADVSEAAPGHWHFGRVDLTASSGAIPRAHLPVAVFAQGDVPDDRPLLHFHGNASTSGADHDSGEPREAQCTGDGKADLVACSGPMLLESPNLSPSAPASWKGGPPEWALTGDNDRTIHDPNWVWCLSVHADCPTTGTPAPGTTTLEGEMTVEWWTECLALCLGGSGDWFIRLWADGVQVQEWRVTLGPSLPGVVEKLRTTVQVPRTTASQRFTLQVEPVFLVDQAIQFGIYYDSTQACPGVSAGPCDSVVRMPVVGGGQPENRQPDAVDDSVSVQKGGAATTTVLANDSDPDGDSLGVASVGAPQHGTATANPDGTVTYSHNGDSATSDSFTYTISDGRGGSDTATVAVAIASEPPPPSGGDGKTTGGGWLMGRNGGKLNFGFTAESSAAGLEGELQLNDKPAGVKIDLSQLTSLDAVESGCGSVPTSSNALELRGTGTYNGAPGATFRVCVQDSGEGAGAETGDRFYLECTGGCTYDTGSSAADDGVDGGNVQVRQSAPTTVLARSRLSAAASAAVTLILDPVLLSEGVAGQAQLFTVRAYDRDQELLANAAVTLTRTRSDGTVETLSGITGIAGTAMFTIVTTGSPAELVAHAGDTQSNAIEIAPVGG